MTSDDATPTPANPYADFISRFCPDESLDLDAYLRAVTVELHTLTGDHTLTTDRFAFDFRDAGIDFCPPRVAALAALEHPHV